MNNVTPITSVINSAVEASERAEHTAGMDLAGFYQQKAIALALIAIARSLHQIEQLNELRYEGGH